MGTQKYRILSLDGGGSWALLQVMALQKIYGEYAPASKVLDDFDLVVANSGGSLVAAALADGKTLDAILNMFMSDEIRLSVFYKLSFWERMLLYNVLKIAGIGPKYSSKKKLESLNRLLSRVSNVRMSELPELVGGRNPHFMIATFDFDRQRATFMRSDLTSMGHVDNIKKSHGTFSGGRLKEVSITKAIHAASNAPINYFDHPAEFSFINDTVVHRYWDGAVGGYNNPALAGLIEALVNGKSIEDIEIRSIGTGSVLLPLAYSQFKGYPGENYLFEPYEKAGPQTDIKKMTASILSDPPDAANFIAYSILNPGLPSASRNYVRISPLIQPILRDERWAKPDDLSEEEFKTLVKLDMDATDKKDVLLIKKLGELWLEDKVVNQPIRTDSEMSCVIGHGSFNKAVSSW